MSIKTRNEAKWQEVVSQLKAGQCGNAVATLRKLIDTEPGNPEYEHALGYALNNLGQGEEAAKWLHKAVRKMPDHPEYNHSLGVALALCNRNDEAELAFAKALKFAPSMPTDWIYNYGIALEQNNKPVEAERIFRAVTQKQADYGKAYTRLGLLLFHQKRYPEARDALLSAIAISPDSSADYANLGIVYRDMRLYTDAERVMRKSIELEPDNPMRKGNLGVVLTEMGRYEESERLIDEARILEPDNVEFIQTKINIYHRTGQAEKAFDFIDQVKAKCPDKDTLRYLLAYAQLAHGLLDVGWDNHVHRWKSRVFGETPRHQETPAWQGEPLQGKHILIHGEQGIADHLWYASLIPELAATGARIAVEVDHRLMPIMARSFPDATIAPRLLPAIIPPGFPADYQLPMADLPRFFRRKIEDFDHQPVGYLKADPKRAKLFGERLAALGPGLRIGVSWRSTREKDNHRSLTYPSLETWQQLMKAFPNAHWITLQYDKPEAELAQLENDPTIKLHRWDDLDLGDDQDGIAALISQLDLVIGPANAPIVLAAALGVNTFSLWSNNLRIYWRQHGTDEMPWFPNMRIFKRLWHEDWTRTFNKLHGAISEEIAKKSPSLALAQG